ncbi:UNVERIFIED_CONTAM: hypothetical protein RMT77_015777 [Armadillidium vulgare]
MSMHDDDLSDGDFWDIGDDKKIPQRKKPLPRGSTSFPSLSVFISCKEEPAKDDSGNTVSISIPDIANVSELRINEQVVTPERQEDVTQKDNDQFSKESVKAKGAMKQMKKTEDSTEDAINDDASGTVTYEVNQGTSLQEPSEDELQEEHEAEDDFGDILFFDNSEPKTFSRKATFKRNVKHQTFNRRYKGDDRHILPHHYPPQILLKHWLYRGRKLLSAGDGPMTVDAFVRSYALSRIVHGASHWRTARCKVFLARAYFYLLNYSPQAITHITEANEVINSFLSKSIEVVKKPQIHHTLAWAHLIEGEAKISLKMYRQAFPSLSRSLYHTKQFSTLISRRKKLKASMKMDSPIDLTLNILCAQSRLYDATGNSYKARVKLEECVQVVGRSKNLEQKEMKMASILKTLGDLILRNAVKQYGDEVDKDLDEGLNYLKTSLKLIQKHKRPGSAKECELRFLIAKHNLKYEMDNFKSIWWELHKLKIWSVRIHGHSSSKTKAIQDCLIQVLIKEGNYDEALNELRDMLMATRASLGDCNIQVCNILRQMITIYVLQKSFYNALSALEQCLSYETLLFGSHSRRVQTLKLKIKDLLFEVPPDTRRKMFKRYPELQQRPPFRPFC